MTLSRAVAAAAALSLFSGIPRAQNKTARDWAKNPAVVQIDTAEDVFAIGDVHGDCDRLLKLLSAAGLVEGSPAQVHWAAGRKVLLFTGDMVDKGPKAPEVLALLQHLRTEAAQAGGQVVVLTGNHEIDFLRGPLSDKAKEFAGQLEAAGFDPVTVAACKGDLGAFLCSLPFAARVNGWFFSHAGNSGGRTMQQLIADLQSGFDREGYSTAQLTGANSLVQARLGEQGPGGKSWFENGDKTFLPDHTAALGVAHVVQGHQHAVLRLPDGKHRKLGQIYQWRGLLFLIDVGLSQDIDESHGAVLRMRPNEASAICPDGRVKKLWDAAKPESSKGARCGS
uniref:Metallophosphoesterase n=1 Tax=Solibacter usitatus (strain Ellin6076) TaxID=234267 RepID=Q01ZC2_SOLUE